VQTKSNLVQALIVVFGLAVYIVARQFATNIDFAELIAELGLFIAVILSLHWLYEITLRKDVAKEISTAALMQVDFPSIREELNQIQSFITLSKLGLANAILNSRELNYSSFITGSEVLVASFNWSADWIKDNAAALRKRAEARKQTILLMLDTESAAAGYLGSSSRSTSDMKRQQIELIEFMKSIFGTHFNEISVKYFPSILSYSFVQIDNEIWIRFYRNSRGYYDHVPAFSVSSGSPLYKFFDENIRILLTESK
jgi:hypothetical protein